MNFPQSLAATAVFLLCDLLKEIAHCLWSRMRPAGVIRPRLSAVHNHGLHNPAALSRHARETPNRLTVVCDNHAVIRKDLDQASGQAMECKTRR